MKWRKWSTLSRSILSAKTKHIFREINIISKENYNLWSLEIYNETPKCIKELIWPPQEPKTESYFSKAVLLLWIIMSPPFRVGRHIVFPRASSVCLSVRLSVTNRVHSITRKPLKLYSRIFIQISISMRRRAECKNGNSAFYTFWVISLWTLCITIIVSAL